MKKKLCAMMLILGLVIAQIPGAGVITASADDDPPAAVSVDMHVWTPSHGQILINGSAYGTEFQGTWYEGTPVQIEAVPDSGYSLDYWWVKGTEGGERVASTSTTITAGTNPEAVAYFRLNTATLTIAPPVAGQTAATNPEVTLPDGAGYSVQSDSMWGPGLSWVDSANYNAAQIDSTTTFVAGQTYYAKVRLRDDGAGFAATAGGSTFNTDLSVTGGEKMWQSNGAYTETGSGGYVAIEAIIAVVAEEGSIPTPPDVEILVPIPAVTVNVVPPVDGSSAADALSAVSVPAGENYSLYPVVDCFDQEPAFDNFGNRITEPFTGTFEKDKTYYMGISVKADPGYMFQQGDVDIANTTVTVNGATLLYGSDLWISNYASDAGFESYGYLIVSFTPVPVDIWFDETVDNSQAFIGGTVKLTGSGGTQAGYNFGTLVYNVFSKVPYTEPKTAEVQAHIDAAYAKAYDTANACKSNGKSGEFTMSFTESIGNEWDSRAFKTFEYNSATAQWEYEDGKGNTEVYIAPQGTDPRTKIHVASGDYGKYTFYSWEANGSVSGWDITVTNDGNLIALADLETSLAGATVTLTAESANSCYAFKEWQVVSGGAVLADSTAASTTFTMPGSDVEIKAVSQPTHTLEKTEKVDPTCTEPGTEAYWTCSVCKKMFSDEAGTTEITEPIAIPAGHDWGEWKVVKEATETEDGEEARTCARCEEKETRPIPKLVIEYRNTEGDGSEWKKGSDSSLTFVFKRSEKDEVTFSHFTGIKMDGTNVAAANYDAVSGSVKITLKPGYLETLEAGTHTLTAMFDDADAATASFTITNKELAPTATPTPAPNKSPNTGDDNNIWLWAALFIASLAVLYVTVNRRSKVRK